MVTDLTGMVDSENKTSLPSHVLWRACQKHGETTCGRAGTSLRHRHLAVKLNANNMAACPKLALSWRHTSEFIRTILVLTLLLLAQVSFVKAGTYFPPVFNAAENKPITLSPGDATCGFGGRARTFCRSSTDPSTVTACILNKCDTSCAKTQSLPHHEDAFSRVYTGWGSCVRTVSDNPAPYPASSPLVEFRGDTSGGQLCYLDLDQSWMVQIKLKDAWSIALTTWIRPKRTGRRSTIFNVADTSRTDLLRIVLDEDLRLKVALLDGSGQSYVQGMSTWEIPEAQWTHLALQVQDDWLAVHLNGSFVSPALYRIPYRPPNRAALYRMGRSFSGSDYYEGHLQDFRIYVDCISNREVQEVYTNSLPSTRIMPRCRCPPSRPKLKPSDHFYCVSNDGTDRPTNEQFRLKKGADGEAFPIEYANDGKMDSAWVSLPGVMETTISLDLDVNVQVHSLVLVFYSPLPDLVTIQRKDTVTSSWKNWHYFAHDCPGRTGLEQDGDMTSSDSVVCQSMVPINTSPPSSEGVLTFDLLTGRPGHVNGSVTSSLHPFLQARQVQITLKDMPFVTNDDHKYHGLYEIKVNTRCECNTHGSECDLSVSPYLCTCAPDTHTRGRQCEECTDDAFRPIGGTVQDDCLLCDCYSDGTVGGDLSCDLDGGQCRCKGNVQGRRCDSCKPGYTSLMSSDPEGCQTCGCNSAGTVKVNGSLACDAVSGQCPCKTNVNGGTCSRCKYGFYNMLESNPDGCEECACHAPGSRHKDCDQDSGQCVCKTYTTDRACDSCEQGYFNLTSGNSDGCQACNCDPRGSFNSSCNPTSGQCFCRPGATGRTCDQCSTGFYAQDENDFLTNGCTLPCDCNPDGTMAGSHDTCEQYSGQCTCKGNAEGRSCDKCKSGSYNLGSSGSLGCKNCQCNRAGTAGGSTSCNPVTGHCDCKVNVQSRECDVCKPGTYSLSASDPNGCKKCGCYLGGVNSTTVCDDRNGRCHCLEGAGDPAVTAFTCNPYVKNMSPKYGPESGGTVVKLEGGFLASISQGKILFDDIPCDIIRSNHTHVSCLTRSLRQLKRRELKNKKLSVILEFDKLTLNLEEEFTYLEDPTISKIHPMKTFLNGGLKLTVGGTYLNSVAFPRMIVYMNYYGLESNFSSECEVQEAREMICLTPKMKLPSKVTRQRRGISSSFLTVGLNHMADSMMQLSHPEDLVRSKRDTDDEDDDDDDDEDDGKLNGENTKFYLGFKLDGVTLYRNLSNVKNITSELTVYRNPDFDKFIEFPDVQVYRPFWPFSHEHIDIKGSYLDAATRKEHYTITVGVSDCSEVDLSSNVIRCRPPQRQPEAEPHAHHANGAPEVLVEVGNIKALIGYLKYEHNFWENIPFRYGIIGGAVSLVLLLLLLLLLRFCCRKRQKPDKAAQLEMRNSKHASYISAYYSSGESDYLNPTMELLELLPRDLKQNVHDCLIDYKRMQLGKMVGQGQFGRVYIGKLADEFYTNDITVAIKTLREYHVTPRDVIQFLEEATVMKDLRNEHVLHLLGVVLENNRAYVILPYMAHGDLKTFISSEDNMLTVGDLINFAQQVAEGMVYLSEQKFVHRDLAARNCMVGSDLMVKIADFGLSRDIYESDYYKEGDNKRYLPVKWMALESLETSIFTSKSDVWAFGVVLWELMTRGCQPYPDVDPFDLKTYLARGNRMDKPDYAPDDIYGLMMWCWSPDPAERPTFRQVVHKLEEILAGQNANTVMRNKRARLVHPHTRVGHNYLDMFV